MKKIIKTAVCIILAAAAAGCAKQVTVKPNDASIRYFNSWMKVNHPDAKPTGLGIYVLEETEGTGVEVKKDGYVYADYTISDLEGNITIYTDEETARQLGTYDEANYYGPKVIKTFESSIQAGLADAIIGMKAGGHKRVIIPSWLMTYYRYDTAGEYMDFASTGANTIYDITVKDFTDSVELYEDNLIKKYMEENRAVFQNPVQPHKDTAFYYQSLARPAADPDKFEKDTTIYINYTGRLINGKVFDTTDKKIAKDNGIYSATRTYEPTQINWTDDWSKITMGSGKSSVVSGFAMTIAQMQPMEKGIGIFYSPLGYQDSGSGSKIPGYAPLIFEIEIVEKPKD